MRHTTIGNLGSPQPWYPVLAGRRFPNLLEYTIASLYSVSDIFCERSSMSLAILSAPFLLSGTSHIKKLTSTRNKSFCFTPSILSMILSFACRAIVPIPFRDVSQFIRSRMFNNNCTRLRSLSSGLIPNTLDVSNLTQASYPPQ